MKKMEKTIQQIIRFRSRIETFFVSIEYFASSIEVPGMIDVGHEDATDNEGSRRKRQLIAHFNSIICRILHTLFIIIYTNLSKNDVWLTCFFLTYALKRGKEM